MSVMQVSDVITPDAPTPFLTFKGSSASRSWEGLFAFNYQTGTLDDPQLSPTAVWPVENITLHSVGSPMSITLSRDGRWSKAYTHQGRLCIYPRDQLIKAYWDGMGEFVAFGVSKDLMQQIAAEVRSGDPAHIQLQGFGVFDDPMLTLIGFQLLGLLQETGLSARLYAESLGVTMAHHLLYHYGPDTPYKAIKVTSAINHPQIKKAVEYIHAYYMRDLSLAEIAAAASLSVAHFTRLFRKATGYTPHDYLIRHRVEQAYFLFQQRKYSGAEIARQVGFYDESHLLRYFKRIYGTTPAKLFR